MFKKILAFFQNLLASIFGGKKDTAPAADREEALTREQLPGVNLFDAQDASEIKDDQTVIVVDEDDPVLNPEDPPTENGSPDPFPSDDSSESSDAEHGPEGPYPTYLWILDPGHGKLTAGKRSPVFDDGHTRLYEYEFNRDIVQRIAARLDQEGLAYFITVPEVEVGDFLKERVQRANDHPSGLPKRFVSVHANAAPAPSSSDWAETSISGIETWYFHKSSRGRQMAAVFQRHLIEATGWKNRHLKSRPRGQFYVLQYTRMPAILTENGFYNNQAQAFDLMQPEIRQKIAEAHVQAILEIESSSDGSSPSDE